MASNGESLHSNAPSGATGAVLKASDPVPESAVPVKGLDFDAFADRNITVAELVENLASVGFQATSIGQAVDIVNGMVRIFAHFSPPFLYHNNSLMYSIANMARYRDGREDYHIPWIYIKLDLIWPARDFEVACTT